MYKAGSTEIVWCYAPGVSNQEGFIKAMFCEQGAPKGYILSCARRVPMFELCCVADSLRSLLIRASSLQELCSYEVTIKTDILRKETREALNYQGYRLYYIHLNIYT